MNDPRYVWIIKWLSSIKKCSFKINLMLERNEPIIRKQTVLNTFHLTDYI